jgi:hypothetical protein
MESKKLWKCEIDGINIVQQKQNKMWTLICTHKKIYTTLICTHKRNLRNIDPHTQKKFSKHLSMHKKNMQNP